MTSWSRLDNQLKAFEHQLMSDVKVSPEFASRLATTLAAEIRFLPVEAKQELLAHSPIGVSERYNELVAFQGWMDFAGSIKNPFVTRAQVVTQNYMCFVYLSESLFLALRKLAPEGSQSKKCAKFLTDDPIRSLRNAIAHANWKYNENYSGLIYYARKGDSIALDQFEVDQSRLDFWQALARCTAYAIFQNLI